MNKYIKLSIIIPIYGVEKYIGNFLNSLLNQLTDEVECIFVNDGSVDGSISTLKKIISKYPKINYQILEQKNQGLSIARNNGMKKAGGEYFTFLDSDDEVSCNYVSEIIKVINKNNFDIMHINASRINSKGRCEEISLSENEELISKTSEYINELFNRCHWYAWLRIFNKKYLDILSFEKNKTFEDILSIPPCYDSAQKIYNLPKSLVIYHFRENSISNNKNNLLKNINSFIFGISFYKNRINNPSYLIIYSQLILMAMYTLNENGFSKYIDFCKKFKKERQVVIDMNVNLKKNDKFILKKPIIYYLYKKQGNFFRFKFLRKTK